MSRKRERFDIDEVLDEIEPIEKPVEEPVEPEVVSIETVSVRVITTEKFHLGGKVYLLVATVEGPLRGYLVEEGRVAYDTSAVQQIEVVDLIPAYDWEQEIEALLPDRETMKRNLLLSFWRAGAVTPDDVQRPAVRRNLYDTAFPYRMEE